MEQQELITKIQQANKIEDIVTGLDFDKEFKNVLKQIHPDVCNLPGTADAVAKMNDWRDVRENGKEYKDDAGVFRASGYWAKFESTNENRKWSLENYRIFQGMNDKRDKNFQQYLPKEAKLAADGSYQMIFDKRSIPLSELILPQEHVNWVLNRLLEYCAYLSEIGMCHAGLNPESVFITPENHGIQIVSFYHLARLGNPVKTISGKYKHWYPHELFTAKSAAPEVDLKLCTSIAAYLLGDRSGSGVKLKKTHNEDFINFIIAQHTNAYQTLMEYRELLSRNFKKEFHSLTI